VPKFAVKPVDLLRDQTVKAIYEKAKAMSALIQEFKIAAMSDVETFIATSAAEYGAAVGGKKGNVTLMSYDGRFKIQRTIADFIVFDERLQIAKEMIDACINTWSEGSNENIRALVTHAFKTDREGKISTDRVLALRSLAIDDEEWQNAMEALTDSIKVNSTKSYIRIYERVGTSDRYQAINLDIATA
jgi:hypothetical protein